MVNFWKVYRPFKLGNKYVPNGAALRWAFFMHVPTQLSALPKKRERRRSKNAVVRTAKIKGMSQFGV